MIVKRVIRNEDGTMEATLLLTPEQAAFLINTGLGFLVQSGAAQLVDMSMEEYEAQRAQNPEQPVLAAPAPDVAPPSPALEASILTGTATTVYDKEAEDKAQKAYLEACNIEFLPKA